MTNVEWRGSGILRARVPGNSEFLRSHCFDIHVLWT